MKAVGYLQRAGGVPVEALEDIELERPDPGGRDLLVQVQAVSVNPVDTKVRRRPGAPDAGYRVLGWDAVGTVAAVGREVTGFQPGDSVWYAGDITRPGSNSEYQLVDERIAGRRPQRLSVAEAAAIPLTAITAWELLFERLGLPAGDAQPATAAPRLLITGAAGGVGSMLVQLARQLTDAVVIGTASRPESREWVKNLGAHHVLDHSKSLPDELNRTGLDSVTHVASLTHSEVHFDALVDMLAPQGRLALIDDPETVPDVRTMKLKSLSLHWELMFTRSMFQTDDMAKQGDLLNRVADLIDTDQVRSTLGAHYGQICAANLQRAHRDIETGRTIGKIVLEGFDMPPD